MTEQPTRTVYALDGHDLPQTTLAAWHQQTHLRAGLMRVTQAQLCLPRKPGDVDLQKLAQRLAQGGAVVSVLVVPGLKQPELRMTWAAWHAPPKPTPQPRPKSYASNPSPTQRSSQPQPQPQANPHPTPIMKNFIASIFSANPSNAASQGTQTNVPDEPQLVPMGVKPAVREQRQVNQALTQIGQHIVAQEVQDLLETVPNCRFQLWTLTFWVSAANQNALRSLIGINQKDAQLAKQHVQGCFAKADVAHLLNTVRLKLEFKAGDSLPRDASEVLVVCGRDNVTLPYSYTGQFETANETARETAGEATDRATQHRSSTTVLAGHAAVAAPATAPRHGQHNTLHLWAQWPGQGAMQRWRVQGGSFTVGAAETANIRVDHRHVSGEHLVLSLSASGQWQVEDQARNGTNLFDATNVSDDMAEQPLPTRQATPLPLAGVLRLGPLPDDPVLHFQQSAPPAPVNTATAPAPRPLQTRKTELASDLSWHGMGAAGRSRGTATA